MRGRISVWTIALKTFEGIIPSLPVSSLPRNTSLSVLPIVRSVLSDILVAIGKTDINAFARMLRFYLDEATLKE